jgi:hypothetical protein
MPTRRKRVPRAQQSRTITPEAVAAWRAGDYWGLHRALGLKIWQMPDWGGDPPADPPSSDWAPLVEGYERVCAAKAQLIAVAGPPPRRWFYRSAD